MISKALPILVVTLLFAQFSHAQFYGQSEYTCLNNQSNATDGQFLDRIYVYAPAGEKWTVVGSSGLYSIASPAPPEPPIPLEAGTPFYVGIFGRYTLEVIRLNKTPWSLTITNGAVEKELNNYHLCEYADLEINVPEEVCINDLLDIDVTASRGPLYDISWKINVGSILSGQSHNTLHY